MMGSIFLGCQGGVFPPGKWKEFEILCSRNMYLAMVACRGGQNEVDDKTTIMAVQYKFCPSYTDVVALQTCARDDAFITT